MRKEVIEQHLLLMLNDINELPDRSPRAARSAMMQWEVPARVWPQYHEHYMRVSEDVFTQSEEIMVLGEAVEAMSAEVLLLGALHYTKQQVEFGKARNALCGSVDRYLSDLLYKRAARKEDEISMLMSSLFRKWPHFSGDRSFPVPTALGWRYWISNNLPHTTYCNAAINETFWQGHYGSLRKDLLNYMIEQLEAQL